MTSRLHWSSPDKYFVVAPRLDQCAHYPFLHMQDASHDRCEVAYTLGTQVLSLLNYLSKVGSRAHDPLGPIQTVKLFFSLRTSVAPSAFFLESRVTKYCPFPTSAVNPASCDT